MPLSIYIQSVALCDSHKNVLAHDTDVPQAFACPFSPHPKGSSRTVFIKVICQLLPAIPVQLPYHLHLLNLADYKLDSADGEYKHYPAQDTSDGQPVYLELTINNITDIDKCLLGTIAVYVENTDTTGVDSAPENLYFIAK